MDEARLRDLIPGVIAVLVHRGADFATAEDAVQDALIRALETWPTNPPDDPKGWLITTAWRRFLDYARSESARRERELRVADELRRVPAAAADDTLALYFLCAHPSLSPSSAVALTLRAVGGLTTRQIAQAYLVPEATMAQRISRAKRTVSGVRLDRSGDLRTVLRVLYLVFNEGYSGEVDLAAEAIRLARQLFASTDDPEVAGLLALFLLHHARRPARTCGDGRLVPLAEQDRSLWRTDLIAEEWRSCRSRSRATGSASIRRRPPSPHCTPMRRAPRRPTGCRSSSGTTNWSGSATVRWRGSTARSPSGRPTDLGRASPRSPSSIRDYRGTPLVRPICTRRSVRSAERQRFMRKPPNRPRIWPSATT